MGGINPYIQQPDVAMPTQKYRITFLPMNVSIEVDPAQLPEDRDGLPGSILAIALEHGIDIDHACGGVCACSTCHVVVKDGFNTLNEATEEEEDQLDEAPGLKPTSRLACQCVPNGEADLIVEMPKQSSRLLSRAERGELEFRVRLPDLERTTSQFNQMANRVILAILVGTFSIALALLIPILNLTWPWSLPTWGIVLGFVLLLGLGVWLIISILRSNRR